MDASPTAVEKSLSHASNGELGAADLSGTQLLRRLPIAHGASRRWHALARASSPVQPGNEVLQLLAEAEADCLACTLHLRLCNLGGQRLEQRLSAAGNHLHKVCQGATHTHARLRPCRGHREVEQQGCCPGSQGHAKKLLRVHRHPPTLRESLFLSRNLLQLYVTSPA
jgi:hypothetical protein